MRVLILWSGGVESTSILKWFLENTDHSISAVHIHCPSVQAKEQQELKAIQTLKPLLHLIRHFDYDMVEINTPWHNPDMFIQAALLPTIINGTRANVFYRGQCEEDKVNGSLRQRDYVGRFAWEALEGKKGATWQDLSPDHPTHHWTKRQHLDHLGYLAQYCWSCWWPKAGKPCGKCKPCTDRINRSPHQLGAPSAT